VCPDLMRGLGKEDAPMLIRPTALPQYFFWGIRFIHNSLPHRYRDNARRNHALGMYSLRMMQYLRENEDIAYDHAAHGVITIYRDQKAFEAAADDPLNETLSLDLDVLDVDALVSRQPALSDIADQLAGGIHHKTEETGNAHTFCQELHRILSTRGVDFEFGTEVNGFRQSGANIAGLHTTRGERRADAYVLAAASDSTKLSKELGLRLPVKPAKGYSLTCPRGDWPDGPHIPVIDDLLHACVVPVGDQIRVAGTAEFAGYNLDLSQGRIDNLKRMLSAVYPDYADALQPNDIVPWTGLRPMSASGVPIISDTPFENLFVNTGHGPLGWTFAAGSGRLMSDLVSGAPTEIAIEDYCLTRRTALTGGQASRREG
ncbi:MAG: FAD-dependent oxidoreductase, partial [Pseudomonadales bacterium]|nr:FAD-dependent oxidoreductase [Pseudomonadales bacterium]